MSAPAAASLGSGLAVDAAVDFNHGVRPCPVNEFAELAGFPSVWRMKGCPPKPGFTDIRSTRSRSPMMSTRVETGVAGQSVTPAFYAGIVDGLHGAVDMHACLLMEIHDFGAQVSAPAVSSSAAPLSSDGRRAALQHIFATSFITGKPERDVRYEHPVHYVEMQMVGIRFIDHPDVGFKIGEIGRQK